MIEIIAACFANPKPFIAGVILGGSMLGGSLGVIGWCVGYDHAMTRVREWLEPKNRDPETYGDMPTLPEGWEIDAAGTLIIPESHVGRFKGRGAFGAFADANTVMTDTGRLLKCRDGSTIREAADAINEQVSENAPAGRVVL